MRTTRSMAQPKFINNSIKEKSIKTNRKREIKSIQKSTNDESESEQDTRNQIREISPRDDYFRRYGSIYQEYDNFLNKRKKNKKIEFIPNLSEPYEELLGSSNSKDLMKYKSKVKGNQDTFCY